MTNIKWHKINNGLNCVDTVVEHGNKITELDIFFVHQFLFGKNASQIVRKMDRFIITKLYSGL